jgi:hypothetical protein
MKIKNNYTFQSYKISKIYKNLFFKFLVINSHLNKINSTKVFYCQLKITNKTFVQLLCASIFKNFKNVVNGTIFFIKIQKNRFFTTQKVSVNKKDLIMFENILLIKFNNKIYFPKKVLKSNFMKYKENLLLLFQLKIIQIKNISKN